MSHTKKHKQKTILHDSQNFCGSIKIYNSGGVTRTAWIEVFGDDLKTLRLPPITVRNPHIDLEHLAMKRLKDELQQCEAFLAMGLWP